MSTAQVPSPARTTIRNQGIQLLRVAAVGLVLVYHAVPSLLPGGYVGVDVFFVISGYLISGHLVERRLASGRIGLADFYARRIKRLLPAALLVIVLTGAATLLFVPRLAWGGILPELAASAGYAENWLLAAQSTNYLQNPDPAPVQHFWSLGVEEQVYLLWPFLVLLLAGAGEAIERRTARPSAARWTIGVGIALVTVLSFLWSMAETVTEPSVAYFSTLTRAWEFGAGALLALLGLRIRRSGTAVLLAVAGIALVAWSSVAFGAATAFPGWRAAVPVLGAVALLAASTRSPDGPRWRVPPLPALIAVGDASYSIYLWHLPLLTLPVLALGRPLRAWELVLALAASVALGMVSGRWYEPRFRRMRGAPWRTIALGFAASVAAVALALTASWAGDRLDARAQQAIESAAADGGDCWGAAAMLDGCDAPFAWADTVDPDAARADDVLDPEGPCQLGRGTKPKPPCEFGDLASTDGVALLGDSHAGTYLEGLDPALQALHKHLFTWIKGSCSAVEEPGATELGCPEWGEAALQQIADDPSIHWVMMGNYTAQYRGQPARLSEAGIAGAVRLLEAAGKQVLLIRDVPGTPLNDAGHTIPGDVADIPSCVAYATGADDPCTVPRDAVVTDDVMVQASATLGVPLLDLTDAFCDATTCHAVIGGLIAYADSSHLTASFSRTLAPEIQRQLAAVFAR